MGILSQMMNKLFSALGMVTAVASYSINGHLATANIGQDLLTTNNPTVLAAAVQELVALQQFDPDLVYREGMYPFIECSTFADDIKYHGGAWQSDYHFINFPFVDQAGKTTADYPGSDDIATRNITEAIKNIADWLSNGKNGDAYLDSYMYDYIYNRLYPGNMPVARSYALRLLIHYLGDIHQPFHTMARYNDQYPNGDKGANLFPLPYHYMATYIYSLTDATVANRDIDAWAAESWDKAKTMYTGATENEALPQAYLDVSVPKVERDITLGGYRTAWIMEWIYGNVT